MTAQKYLTTAPGKRSDTGKVNDAKGGGHPWGHAPPSRRACKHGCTSAKRAVDYPEEPKASYLSKKNLSIF